MNVRTCLMIAGLALQLTLPLAAQPLNWRVCVTDISAPPYLNNDPHHLGVIERLMLDAGSAVGLKIELLRFPPRRCRQMFEQGQVEASLAAPVTPNLAVGHFPMSAGEIDRSQRLARVRMMWVKPTASALDWDGHQIKGAEPSALLVGTRPLLLVAAEALQRQGFRVDSSGFNSRQLLAKLQAGRVDLVVGIEEDLREALRAPNMQDLTLLPQPFMAVDYYATLSHQLTPQQLQLGERWWQQMGRLRELPAYRPD